MPTGNGKSRNTETLSISADDIAAQLDALEPKAKAPADRDAFTRNEWREKWACSSRTVTKRIKNGMDHGIMESVWLPRDCVDGSVRQVKHYRFVGGIVPKSTPKK